MRDERMVRPDRLLRDPGAAARLAAWGAVMLLAAGSLRAQAFEEVGDVAYRYGVANAGRIRSIAPITSTRVYVGASDGGAWRTVNGGVQWTTPTDFASSLRIAALAAEPSGARVFAATSNPVRLLRSFDGLATVTGIVIPQVAFGGDSISKLVVDPAHAETVYALTTRGLLRSTDDGDSWGVVLPPDARFVDDIAVLAGTEFWVLATRGGELFRSATGDAGSFAPVALPAPPDGMPPYTLATPVLLLAAVPGQPQKVHIVYNGPNEAIYRSDNFGATPLFQARHPRFLARGAFAASADGTTLYSGEITGGNKSLNRGRDGGARWDTPFPGPYHPDVHAVATTASPPYVYVGTDGGLWRYHESTGEWTNLNGDLNTMLVYEAYASRGAPEAIVAGTQDNGAIVHRGVRWAIAGGADVGDAYLLADDPHLGGAFVIISAAGYVQISGDTGGVPPPSLSGPPPCPPPIAGSFGLDRSAPRRVCVATGAIRCSDEGGRDPWCLESADIEAGSLQIVDGMHAWATSFPGQVLRTATGVLGAWFDVTSDLPAGRIVGLDAPEGGDPLRSLVLIGSTTTPPVVYETTDGGISWLPRGVAPVTEPVGVLPVFCGFPPCSDTPERGATALSFAVAFASVLRLEVWFVGTDRGLLQSTDGGATWVDAGIPHVQVNDIDTFGDVVTVGTWGRGVFQKVFDTGVPEFEFLAVDPFWRLRHLPLRIPDLWASDAIAQSNDVIQELRWLGRGGRAFRRGDPPFGPDDFRLVPGAPILIRGDGVTGLQAVGVRPPPRPIPLAPGWNPVAILSPALTTASEAIADAAAQGVIVGAFVGDGGQQAAGATTQAAPGAAPALQDFTLDPTGGYWIYVCGGGGVWTPGAGGAQAARALDAAKAATAAPATVVAPTATIQAAGSICPALDATLQSIAAPLAERVGGEILFCVPEQIVISGNDQITVCDSPPVLETDLRFDNSACHGQPQGRGCAVGITIRQADTGQGDLTLVYDVRTVGTATVPPNQVCSIHAGTTGASFSGGIDQLVDAPAIHLSLAQWSTTLQLDQSGCGAQADLVIAELVAGAVEQTLAAEIGLRIAGLGPVCTPDVKLPDGDADGTPDCTDGCPQDPGKIDPGVCGCGVVDDFDGDGSASCQGDCNDQDGNVWATPGEVLSLLLSHDGANDRTSLSWSPPSAPGAASIVYDVLASPAANDFAGAAQCVESDDGSDTLAIDLTQVPPGGVLHFVVRAVNGCPSGDGTIGSGSDGKERAGRACP